MSGYSNVGQRSVYEAGDQRNYKDSEIKEMNSDPYHEGKVNSHKNLDSSKLSSSSWNWAILTAPIEDERSIANKLAAAEYEKEPRDDLETQQLKKDPTLPVSLAGL